MKSITKSIIRRHSGLPLVLRRPCVVISISLIGDLAACLTILTLFLSCLVSFPAGLSAQTLALSQGSAQFQGLPLSQRPSQRSFSWKSPATVSTPSQWLSPDQSPRKEISFDDDWKFHFGNAADPAEDFNFTTKAIFSKSGKSAQTAIAPDFKDNDWRTLSLPHDWAVELPFENATDSNVMFHGYKPVGGAYPRTSIGWYRKHFKMASSDSGQRFVIRFDGIFRDSRIWINGFYLAANASGYSGISCDITDYIRFDRDNVVVVRVDASQYEGWYYEGAGIYRHVWLTRYNNLHLVENGIFAYTDVREKDITLNLTGNREAAASSALTATVHTESTLINENPTTATGVVTTYITDREGRIVGRSAGEPLRLQVNETRTVKQRIQLSNPILWSPESPYLYRAMAVITAGANPTATTSSRASAVRTETSSSKAAASPAPRTIDAQKIRIGIRSIRIDSSGLYVNGRYTKIKGVNAHQDHAGVGSALPDYLHSYRIHLLKELGANAYRTSHNPPAPELLDACDSLGMLVLDETRLLNSSPEYLGQFERMILRDRSHPSVFLWSIGNEEGGLQTNSTGRRIAQTLLQRQRELDPTRVSTYGADLANVYKGVNEVIPVRGFNYRVFGVAPYHKDHPQQPIVGTEMGSTVTTRGQYTRDSIAGYLPDEDITAPWWANTAEQWWPQAAENSWWMGGFVWTGFDYRGEPTPFQWPNINSHFGVMDMCGFPKNIYYYYQSWWKDEDVLHLSPHWNWQGKEGLPVNVWVNSNADNVELYLNGRSLGKKDMPRYRHLEWNVPYEPGKLEAVAFRKGKRITAMVETTGAPYEIVVTPYKTTMLADGKDASVINISVVDRQGREVPDANALIRFSIRGDLHILGVGNGDPSSHEEDKCADSAWQRHLFNGRCQVIVQAGSHSDLVKFEARGDSLLPGSTDIYTIRPGKAQLVQPVSAASGSTNLPGSPGAISRPTTNAANPGANAANRTPSWTPGRPAGKMLGADISFLPELEAKGIHFSDKGVQKDAIQILKDHGFNYIRLRIFNDPARDSDYSPGRGFCDLEHTKQMARRVKAAGLKFLLDFHYSDYWADPGKQYKPAAWVGEDFTTLQQSVYSYTKEVMEALKAQGTLPDMVQVGNEINHGMIWPEGSIRSPDSLAALIDAGIRGVRSVDAKATIMLHIALGGQNAESHFFLDNMLERGLNFDVIGLSYYPKWHGTLAELSYNLNDLATHYNKDVIVVEYTQRKREVNELAFTVAGGRGKGTCIWEPLSTWEKFVEADGKTNDLITIYDEIHQKFMPAK